MDTNGNRRLSRRRVLGLCAGSVALAGCLGTQEGDPSGTTTDGATDTRSESPGSPTASPAGELLPPPVAGNPDADLTLEVFEDYACGHCAHYNTDGFPQLASSYIETGQIRYEHRDLPFLSDGSWIAASAAREVQAREGAEAFYTYSKSIFANYKQVSGGAAALSERLAEEQDLDAEAIRQAGVDLTHEKTLRRDLQRGKELGVQGTPTFVLNGEIVTSGFDGSTIDTLSSAIDDRL